MLLKHASLDTEETEKKKKKQNCSHCSGEEEAVCKAMGSTIPVRLQKSFKLVSSLISGGKLHMCAGTQGMLSKKFSM